MQKAFYLLEPREYTIDVERVRARQLVGFVIDHKEIFAHGTFCIRVNVTLRDLELGK